jgi:mono/diheme cytochrome c family protein
MTLPLSRRSWSLAAALLTLAAAAPASRAAPPAPPPAVDFSRQILPILSENCFACHGPDEKTRKARLRLDTREGATAKRKGGAAVVPGKSADSPLIERVAAEEAEMRMPPPKTGKTLKPEQVALLRKWIDQGAPWAVHWSLVPPQRPPLPKVADASWPRNPVDRFILARLEAAGPKPTAEAPKARLLRRVTLDLTGLPPTPAEVDAFLADKSPDAYEKVVDRLLESPRYGEHLARYWLDAARYGDTHGLHLDNYREMWPWREWVIRAFNRNEPFDQFLVEQLAGDLLPDASLDQVVASGFNRCHVTTSEGGSISEEVYVRNVVDRVDTFGTVILALSTGCARCHDHKYDPIRQKDYYQLFAFFNSLDDNPLDGNASRPPPVVRVAAGEQVAALERLKKKADAVRQAIAAEVAKAKLDEAAEPPGPQKAERAEYVWIDDGLPANVKPSGSGGKGSWDFVSAPAPVLSGGKSLRRSAGGLTQDFFENAKPGLRVGAGDALFAHVYLDPADPPREIMLQWHTDGWKHRAYWGANVIPWGADGTGERRYLGPLPAAGKWVRLEVEAAKVGLAPGSVITGWAFTQHDGTTYWDKAGILTSTPQEGRAFATLAGWLRVQQASGGAGLPKDLKEILKVAPEKRSAAQKKQLRDYFVENAWEKARATFEPLHRQLAEIDRERERLDKELPATLVSKEQATPRPAYVLKRGEYDQKGEKVGRDTPAFLPPLPAGAPRNRLGLARWLVAPGHPLTARVAVNRFWQQVFGTGIVKTAEDFGSQGELPSHPELLDWLAVQFREDGWDVKKLMRLLVTSAAYRQDSRVTPDRLARDPANRLLSRGPRFRLDAEMVRDQALFVSGLLVEKLGGPSVKPPQPAGLWEAVGYSGSNTVRFTADTGHEKVHRRSLYTFWKRTAPPPQMNALDAPSREACTVRRERTNTPLQALLLLNETQFVECARALAERTLREGGPKLESRLAYLFKRAAGRAPDTGEIAELAGAYEDLKAGYAKDPSAARKLIAVGETKPDPALDPAELAAWTMIANLVLNLDEVLNKG